MARTSIIPHPYHEEPFATFNRIHQRVNVTCLALGTSHQGDNVKFPHSNNLNCVANAACSVVYSAIKHRNIFNTQDIDYILEIGHKLYQNIRQQNSNIDFMEPEQLPPEIIVGGYRVSITSEWQANGLYPTSSRDFLPRLTNLSHIINNVCYSSCENITESFLFTGLNYTVAFWKHDNKFFVFNSHAVDATGRHSSNPSYNFARLFVCPQVTDLANVLLLNSDHITDTREFALHKISIVEQTDRKLTDLRPIVVLQNLTVQQCIGNRIPKPIRKLQPWLKTKTKKTVRFQLNEKKKNDPKISARAKVVIKKIDKTHRKYNHPKYKRYNVPKHTKKQKKVLDVNK